MVLGTLGIGFYKNILAVSSFPALAVEGSLDGAFGARCNGFFRRFGSGTTASWLNATDNQWFVACVLKTERNIQQFMTCLTVRSGLR